MNKDNLNLDKDDLRIENLMLKIENEALKSKDKNNLVTLEMYKKLMEENATLKEELDKYKKQLSEYKVVCRSVLSLYRVLKEISNFLESEDIVNLENHIKKTIASRPVNMNMSVFELREMNKSETWGL